MKEKITPFNDIKTAMPIELDHAILKEHTEEITGLVPSMYKPLGERLYTTKVIDKLMSSLLACITALWENQKKIEDYITKKHI